MNNQLCILCGKSAKPTTHSVCETCVEEYKTIRSYIEEKPLANIMEISNATKISIKRINQFVDNGKFILLPKEDKG
jgi:hypothetical protein